MSKFDDLFDNICEGIQKCTFVSVVGDVNIRTVANLLKACDVDVIEIIANTVVVKYGHGEKAEDLILRYIPNASVRLQTLVLRTKD
jgi:hypothetical protein